MSKNNAWQRGDDVIHSNNLSTHEKETSSGAPVDAINRVELMDVRGLADFLHLDRQTIYNWLHQHKLTGIKVGGVWRFDRRSVEEWLQSRTIEAGMTGQDRRATHNPPSSQG